MTFFIAMQNRRATASYWHPQTIITERNEFLIVSRSGGRNEFLSISNAGACTGLESEAPSRLSPDLVLCATLVSQGPDGGEMFLVERSPPEGSKIRGQFIGGDGYFFLEQTGQTLALRGSARLKPGARTRAAAERCLLLGENEPGATVHFSAAYVPWDNELLPSEFSGQDLRPGAGTQ
ncbi:MAG: hypothetical protein AAF771_04410 [Pseudomonadota bacterium]